MKNNQQQNSKKKPRNHRICLSLNDDEKDYIDFFVKKYKINNTAKYMRQTIIRHILLRLEQDSPTLFD
ncbi:MAG: hypothetical protein LBS50_11720 [Prevotellaceae bacterium]|jgi:hypothetical protein|nr:hypothetical protein [Prevotellaceae bacterium]